MDPCTKHETTILFIALFKYVRALCCQFYIRCKPIILLYNHAVPCEYEGESDDDDEDDEDEDEEEGEEGKPKYQSVVVNKQAQSQTPEEEEGQNGSRKRARRKIIGQRSITFAEEAEVANFTTATIDLGTVSETSH